MNSYYYFITIHTPIEITTEDVLKALVTKFPDTKITVSDEEFEDVR